MTRFSLIATASLGLCIGASSLSTNDTPSRRSFLARAPAVVGAAVVTAASGWHALSCNCDHCSAGNPFMPAAAQAYERRDVGSEGRSPETAAMNIQAYETNNRLEKSGFKMETQQEQISTVNSFLSEYAYTPAVDTSKIKKASKPAKKTKESEK